MVLSIHRAHRSHFHQVASDRSAKKLSPVVRLGTDRAMQARCNCFLRIVRLVPTAEPMHWRCCCEREAGVLLQVLTGSVAFVYGVSALCVSCRILPLASGLLLMLSLPLVSM